MTKYDFVDHEDAFHKDHHCIEVLDGPLMGLIFQYDTVNFIEPEDSEGGDATLQFNTLACHNPDNFDLTDDANGDILGNILLEIITSSLKDMEETDDNRELNSEDLNP
jgi:hypothetical protein